MLIKTARLVTGHRTGLGTPSKMPGYSTAIPATACKVGAKLAKVAGSVCESCYALKGNYTFPDVKKGHQRRLDALNHPQWVEGMVTLIGRRTDPNDPYFRVHDSGDMQSVKHVLQWVDVARSLTWVKIWAPSREIRMIKRARGKAGEWPSNLVVRLSAPMIGEALDVAGPTSSVDTPGGFDCPAYNQDGKCDGRDVGGVNCRACWNPEILRVNYPKH